MSSLKILRIKETYREKIKSKKESTQINIFKSISNFENFWMEKHGKANIIPDLKEADEETTLMSCKLDLQIFVLE